MVARSAQIEAACPALGGAAHRDLADLLVAYVDALGQYHECRAAARGVGLDITR